MAILFGAAAAKAQQPERADDLYECPEHRMAFHLKQEPCWRCFVRAMYGGAAAAGDTEPLPIDRKTWAALEASRATWRPVEGG